MVQEIAKIRSLPVYTPMSLNFWTGLSQTYNLSVKNMHPRSIQSISLCEINELLYIFSSRKVTFFSNSIAFLFLTGHFLVTGHIRILRLTLTLWTLAGKQIIFSQHFVSGIPTSIEVTHIQVRNEDFFSGRNVSFAIDHQLVIIKGKIHNGIGFTTVIDGALLGVKSRTFVVQKGSGMGINPGINGVDQPVQFTFLIGLYLKSKLSFRT